MRFAICSDLHLDHHKPNIVKKTVQQLCDALNDGADYIIMAGDLSTGGLIPKLPMWTELMAPIADRVIFTPGNHDFYDATFAEFWQLISHIGFAHILNNETITLDGITIFGGPLWFDKPIVEPRGMWCDYEWIRGDCKASIYNSSAEFKCNMPKSVDIVVSHHSPTNRSQDTKFLNDAYNCYFVNDCEELIRWVKPKLWVHGHLHNQKHYAFNRHTEIVCNALGYPGNDTGRYDIKIVEVN